MIRWVLSVALLLAPAAFGGVAYTVHQTRAGSMRTYHVSMDQGRFRVAMADVPSDSPVVWDGIIATKTGAIALNSQNQTWYDLEGDISPFSLWSNYLAAMADAKVKKAEMTFAEAPAAKAGEHRYTVQLSYDALASYGSERVKIMFAAVYEVTTTDAYDRSLWFGRVLPHLRYPAAAEKLDSAEPAIHGFPVRVTLHATRRYEGGALMSDDSLLEVTDIHETSVPASMFARPAGYRNQRPVIGAPGGGPAH